MTTRKVALFLTPSGGRLTGDESTAQYCKDYARVTEWVTVEFPALSDDGIAEQLRAIEAAQEDAQQHYHTTLAKLSQRREQLEQVLS